MTPRTNLPLENVRIAGAFLLAFSFAWSGAAARADQPASAESSGFLSAGPIGANATAIESALRNGKIGGLALELRQSIQSAIADAGGPAHLSAVIADPKVRATLVQHELIRSVGEDRIADIAGREKGVEFLAAFLEDPNWVESFLVSDPPAARWYLPTVTFPQALENLYLLHRYGKDLDKPVYRRMATALALESGMLPYRLIVRFKDIQAAHRQGLLHARFNNLDVREMRWAVHVDEGHREFQYLLDERQTKAADYMGACWSVTWLDFNPYGDWLQGPLFYTPWRHVLLWGEDARILGGQCENLSLFGCAAARVHGVMASIVGQPGHAAYIVQLGDKWPVAYDVFGPAVTFFTNPGWDGSGYITANWLCEPVQRDRVKFLTANRMCMIARLLMAEDRAEVRILPGLRYAVYRQGVGDRLPDFSKLTPDSKGTAKGIDFNAVKPNPPTNFGVVWRGQIDVSRAGEVKVILRSDDQSRLSIDNEPVLELNCARQEKIVKLAAGRHALRVDYCQGGGDAYLEVEFRGIHSFGDWKTAYGQAIKAQPLNYGTWIECIKAMEETTGVSPKTWTKFARSSVNAFSAYHEAAWALARRSIEKALPSMKPAERMSFFLDCHEKLRQQGAKQFDGYRYDIVLGWQADQLTNPTVQLEFFSRLLQIHAGEPPNDRLFSMTLEWGQNRFKDNQATAPKFAEIVGDYFRKQGGANKDLLRNQVQNGIRAAGERGDIAAARVWTKLGEELLPRLQPGDISLSPEQAKNFPKVQPFAAPLLSGDGILRTSSNIGEDRPLSYAAMLRGVGLGGFFHTNSEENPWAQVQLPGNAKLSGIVLVNRYEAAQDRQIPLKVSTSLDGKTWTEVARFDKAENVFRVDFQGKTVEAKYVRVERVPTPGRRDFFHLRAILIYGQKLY